MTRMMFAIWMTLLIGCGVERENDSGVPDVKVENQKWQIERSLSGERITRFDDPIDVVWFFHLEREEDGSYSDRHLVVDDGIGTCFGFNTDKISWSYAGDESFSWVLTGINYNSNLKVLAHGEDTKRMSLVSVGPAGNGSMLFFMNADQFKTIAHAKTVECRVNEKEFVLPESVQQGLKAFYEKYAEIEPVLSDPAEREELLKKWYDEHLKASSTQEDR